MPTPPKPKTLKLISGTTRKDRDGIKQMAQALPADAKPLSAILTELPPMPAAFEENKLARERYATVGPNLIASKLLDANNYESFIRLCYMHSKIMRTFMSDEMPKAIHLNTLLVLEKEFGMTPMSAAKIGLQRFNEEKPASKFGRNGKRA